MTIDSIIAALHSSGRHLGDMIFWQLADASVDRATFEAPWAAAGLAAELLPEPPTPEKALKVAAREAAVGQQSRLIRVAVENEEHITFAVVLEALKNEVQAFVAQPPERPSTLARRFDAFDQLRARAALYRDILSVQVKDLDRTLDGLTASIESLLNAKQAA